MSRLPALALCLLLVLAGCATGGDGGPGAGPTLDTGEGDQTITPPAEAIKYQVTVIDVVDGDTVDVRFENGSTDTVRLLGVDTPEVYSQNDPAEYEGVPDTERGVQCLRDAGDDATAFMDQFQGASVTLVLDEQSDIRGSYGRLLAYVYASDRNVNYRLVAEGYARVYDSQFTHREPFYAAETRAQESQLGLWSCRSASTTTPLADGGVTEGPLAVASIQADAPGNDNENLGEEYVVFENTGSETLDVSGWVVSDAADHRYTMPAGTTIDPGATLTLYTGSGTDSETARYWGQNSAIWNNGGDTISVETADGTVVLTVSY